MRPDCAEPDRDGPPSTKEAIGTNEGNEDPPPERSSLQKRQFSEARSTTRLEPTMPPIWMQEADDEEDTRRSKQDPQRDKSHGCRRCGCNRTARRTDNQENNARHNMMRRSDVTDDAHSQESDLRREGRDEAVDVEARRVAGEDLREEVRAIVLSRGRLDVDKAKGLMAGTLSSKTGVASRGAWPSSVRRWRI
mmetsp:Transcript_10119/g.33094  ORF Transcript_10119/g.33094 Transcript_10119/m.33094 type:complete len:193 (+) Transcript_10119:317-895(+)